MGLPSGGEVPLQGRNRLQEELPLVGGKGPRIGKREPIIVYLGRQVADGKLFSKKTRIERGVLGVA